MYILKTVKKENENEYQSQRVHSGTWPRNHTPITFKCSQNLYFSSLPLIKSDIKFTHISLHRWV